MLENTKTILNAIVPGVKAEEYLVDDSYRHKGYGSEFDGSILVYNQETLIAKEGPFKSQFDLGLNIGRKRFMGRLEYITGLLMTWGGLVATGVAYTNQLSGDSDWPMQVVIGFNSVVVGVMLAMDGRARKDIATSIINKMSQRQTSSISESNKSPNNF
ncbi:MAG: hypothetical protein WCV81_05860 [Microgenomates group bacterium]|jgi:hypothetical protein